MPRLLPFAFLLTLLTASFARADELELKNGDRLTGTAISLAGGTLAFTTPYGDVAVPWADVVRLVVTDPILVVIGTAEPVPATIGSAAAGQVTLQPGGVVPLPDITALSRPQPPIVVDGSANAGFVTAAGNTEIDSLRLDGDLVARTGSDRYTVTTIIARASDSGIETARNWTTGFKYDRFITQRLFFNGNSILTNDRFRDLDLRTALGAGVGYQVLNSLRATLTTDAGLGYVHENLESQPDDSYAALRESATLGVFVGNRRIEVFHQHDGYFGVTGDDNLFVRTQNGVRLVLAAGFVATIRHDIDYDRSPAIGRRQTDRALSLTLGYRF